MDIRKRTFKKPTHVKWFDFFEDGEFKHGIAFNGVVICSCCGGVIPLEEIYEAELCGDITPEERMALIDYMDM